MAWKTPKLDWNPGDGIMAGDLNRIEGNIDELANRVYSSVTIGGIVPYDVLNANYAYITGITSVHIRERLFFQVRSVGLLQANTPYYFGFIAFHPVMPNFDIGDSGGSFMNLTNLRNSAINLPDTTGRIFEFATARTFGRLTLADLGLDGSDTLIVSCGVGATHQVAFKGSVMATLIEESYA